MAASEIFKLIADYGLAGLVGLLMWRSLPALIKTLSELKEEFIKALHEHSDKDMVRHEETRAAIGDLREDMIVVKTRLEERADAPRAMRNNESRR